jgi:nicotinate-nucleotide adenylyltransferase
MIGHEGKMVNGEWWVVSGGEGLEAVSESVAEGLHTEHFIRYLVPTTTLGFRALYDYSGRLGSATITASITLVCPTTEVPKTMRLGLFGGSFDPVHYGHLLLAECCREQCRLDRVLFLPAAVPPHKQGRELTPAEQRIEMLQLAIAGNESFAVSRFEVDRGGISYTVDTLRHFRQEAPEGELFLLVGADMLYDLPRWREAAVICQLAIPVAVRRPGIEEPGYAHLAGLVSPERLAQFCQYHLEMPEMGLSGSELRRRVTAGRSIRYQTPRAVEKYIETHGLYGGERVEGRG